MPKDDEPPTIRLQEPSESAKFKVNQQITIKAEITDNTSVQWVRLFYGFSRYSNSEPAQYNQKNLTKTDSSIYTGHIPLQTKVGFLRYYITATDAEGNESKSEARRLEIRGKDNAPPTILLLEPSEGAKFEVNQQITIRAKVIDETSVKAVSVHFLPSNSLNGQKLSEEGTSDIYTIDITQPKAGYIWYYLTATDEEGKESRSEQILIKIGEPPGGELRPKIHQGIWANYAHVLEDGAFVSDWGGDNMLSFAYLREGKTHQTLGAQLDFSYQNLQNASATVQWGPALQKSPIVFTFLGGIARYKSSDTDRFETNEATPTLTRNTSEESTHITPILGASLKLYPADRVTIDAAGSIKLRSVFDTTHLYHYEMGIRVYIARGLNLRIGYGQRHLGDRNITNVQVGLGVTF